MVFKKITWYSIILISGTLLILLSFGFYKAMKVTYNAKLAFEENNNIIEEKNRAVPSLTPGNKTNTVRVTILGDSIAKGTGDEKGKGFAGYIPDYFKNLSSKDVLVENAGINGLRSTGMLEQLQSGILEKVLIDSDFILISIGGNDARSVMSVNEISRDEEFNTVINRYLFSLKESVKIIRKANPDCIIVFVGIYNPGSETGDNKIRLIKEWNFRTESVVDDDSNTVFIDTYGLFKLNAARYVAPDRLHPNSAGYQAISAAISKSVESILLK